MKIKSLLTWLCVVGSSIGLSASAEKTLLSAQPSERSGTIPLETQYAVSAALGRDQAAYHVLPLPQADFVGAVLVACPLRYHVALNREPLNREPLNHAETSYQAANPNQHFNARFDAQGASVVSAGTHWNLSVQAWGYGDQDYGIENIPTLREVGTTALAFGEACFANSARRASLKAGPFVSANRVEYHRGALTEWYVNGPLGLQQGFTVQAPPTQNNGPGRAPLTFVLNLPGGGHSHRGFAEGYAQARVDTDRTGLTLLTDKNEPVLRYSGLTTIDADGRRLPAWLETRENKLLLCVDDTKARYPIAIDPFVQQAKLIAADGAASNEFGNSVALSSDGDTAIVGAYYADVGGNVNQGAAYIFTRSGAVWSQQAKLTASDGIANDYFGISVALSSDGDTAIVGAAWDDMGGIINQGAAYVFTRSGSSWSQQEKLTASDGAANDFFGVSVALSGDGNTICAGAYVADVSENINQGAAYIFTRSGAAWSQHAKLTGAVGAASDLFGVSVTLNSDGNTAIVGAEYADVGGNADRGAAYVFTRSGDSWTQRVKLIAVDGAAWDYFGSSVALSSDGDTAIVGARMADVGGNADQGAAYVFTHSGDSLHYQAKLTSPDGAANDLFGNSVTLSGDGNTAIAGAYGADVGGNDGQGAAYVFTRSGSSWSQQAKLTASDGVRIDYFGISVALSSYGNTAIVGAFGANVGGNTNQGAAYVFADPLPTGVGASYDFYIDRVRVTWDATAAATGYEVWRGASNDTSQATRIGTGISGTNYDDMAATAGTPYYYWVKTIIAGGASAFSASAIGRLLFGPDVRLNGAAGPVTVAVGSNLVVTVSMNPAQYVDYPMDWWVVASSPFGLYYLNSGMEGTPAGALDDFQPVYQGGLLGLQSGVALDTTALPTGTYTFYFGVDTLNGVLDPDVVYDSATVTVAP